MNVWKHYIEEMDDGSWRWTHVRQGGLLPSGGPAPSASAAITLHGNQYNVDPRFDRKTIAARPAWAVGLIALGVIGLVLAAETAAFPLGAALFAIFGLGSIFGGLVSYQKSFHMYALFLENQPWQVPFIRQSKSLQVVKEIVDTTTRHNSEAGTAKKISEFIHPEMPWPLIIAAAVGGLGIGAIIGVVAGHIR